MKKFQSILACSAAFLFALSTYADGGLYGSGTEESAGQPGEAVTKGEPAPMGMGNKEMKQSIAPHTVVILSSLESARDHIRGLKAQYEVAETPSKSMIDKQLKFHRGQIDSSLKRVSEERERLQGIVKQYPELASSEEFRSVNMSLTQVKSQLESWKASSDKEGYWSDKSRVMSDLENFDKNVASALDKTRTFNTDRLEFTAFG